MSLIIIMSRFFIEPSHTKANTIMVTGNGCPYLITESESLYHPFLDLLGGVKKYGLISVRRCVRWLADGLQKFRGVARHL